LGYSLLQKQAQRQLGYGEYYLVVVTDGEADRETTPVIVNKIVSESPVIISTIGFCIGEGHSLNRPGLTMYHDATNLEQLNQGLESVLAESEFSATAGSEIIWTSLFTWPFVLREWKGHHEQIHHG
jgi:Ca-activated chloride channel family protein